VKQYRKKHKKEYEQHCENIKLRRRQLLNARTGTLKDKKMRVAASIPVFLTNQFDMVFDNPRFLADTPEAEKELHWFCQKFPEFVIPHHI
jgi:hypothetical protein